MIEVFKTDVQEKDQARRLLVLLQKQFPESRINFDLDDCDRILRVEGDDFKNEELIFILERHGFYCVVLE
ncbi:MAG: hypothetical protein ACJ75B_17805 [Flavisolibacter sp.]|jgi:hypothetical protein